MGFINYEKMTEQYKSNDIEIEPIVIYLGRDIAC